MNVRYKEFWSRAAGLATSLAAVVYVVVVHQVWFPTPTSIETWQSAMFLIACFLAWQTRRIAPLAGIHADGLTLYRYTKQDHAILERRRPKRPWRAPLIAAGIFIGVLYIGPGDGDYLNYVAGALAVLVLGHSAAALLIEGLRYPQRMLVKTELARVKVQMMRERQSAGVVHA